MKQRHFWLALVALILSRSAASFAQEGSVPLNESTVMERVLELSRTGKISRLQAEIANVGAQKARAPYDHTLAITGSHQIDASEKVISVFGDRTDTTQFKASLHRTFPTGTLAEIGYQTSRSKTDSPFVTLNPAFNSAWFVGLRQPLWRDSFGSSMREQIESAEAGAKASQAKSEAELDGMVFQGLQAFWTWIAYSDDERIAQRGVKRAQEFLTITKSKLRLGTAEKADLYAAEASLALRQQDVLVAQERAKNALTELKNLLLLDTTQTVSTSSELTTTASSLPLEEHLTLALQTRHELRAAQEEVVAAEKAWRSLQSGARPQFDVFTQLTLNDVDDGWPGSAGGAFASNDPNWTIGGELTLPFENRLLKSERETAEIRAKISALQLAQMKQNIQTEVTVAWDSFTAAQEQSRKAARIEELQKKKLEEEEKDFRRGRSDAFTVLAYQQDLIASERQKLSALAREVLAQKALNLATGNLRGNEK